MEERGMRTPLIFATIVGLLLAGCEKARLDAQVKELCAKDGGIKVYETVKLPPDKFNQWGQPNFYKPTQGEDALGREYIFKEDRHYYRSGNPEMSRRQYEIIRRSDGKRLAVSIVYGRGGGDMPGPWHDSSVTCHDLPEGPVNTLMKEVFLIENIGGNRK
jgi:hypothetical protein